MNCCIPLISGIGNVIQGLPFLFEMKNRYDKVEAFKVYVDFPDTSKLLDGIVEKIYDNQAKIPNGYKIFKAPRRRSFSESMSWFIDNKEKSPTKLEIPFINYTAVSDNFDIVIWPECKTNWPCKKWVYWTQLIKELSEYNKKIAIVGLETNIKYNYKNVTDYRSRLSLLQTGGVIKNSKIFIGNEGGISHYSAALGTKTYIIFGCTDPKKNMPPNNAIPVSKGLPCQPCQFNGLKQIGIRMDGCDHRRCLSELTTENVLEIINL